MWALFAVAAALLALLSVVPGLLSALAIGVNSPALALSIAPSLSISLYALVGIALGALELRGIAATAFMLVIPIVFGIIGLAIRSRRHTPSSLAKGITWTGDFSTIAVYVAVALVVCTVFFVKNLDGPASYSQQSDNISHLSSIIEIALDGNYSLLSTASYPLAAMADGSAPFASTGFYPNGFHVLASFAVSLLGVSAPLAENATLLVFMAVIYPLSSFGLMWQLFGNERRTLLAGALATSAFASFPLGMLLFGPIYPNMAAFCCVPSVVLTFILAFNQSELSRINVSAAIAFLLSSIGTAALQPNAIFTAGVLLIPYCCHLTYKTIVAHGRSAARARAGVAALLVLIALIWVFLVYSPFMRNVTSFDWPALDDPVSGIGNTAFLELRVGLPQYVLAALVLIGLIRCLKSNDMRWAALAYLLAATLYYVGNSFDSGIKQLLTGFWYTDQWRTAANVALIGAPIAASGISAVLDALQSAAKKITSLRVNSAVMGSVSLVTCVAIAFAIFWPWDSLGTTGSQAAFGHISQSLDQLNRLGTLEGTNSYTEEERSFVEQVCETIPEGSTLINMPADGSVYAYLDGSLDLYYKTALKGGETSQSEDIRLALSNLDVDKSVRDAVRSTGASYVILLERNGFVDQGDLQYTLCCPYQKSHWTGMNLSDLDQARSLEIVLSEGNMRLYKINL